MEAIMLDLTAEHIAGKCPEDDFSRLVWSLTVGSLNFDWEDAPSQKFRIWFMRPEFMVKLLTMTWRRRNCQRSRNATSGRGRGAGP